VSRSVHSYVAPLVCHMIPSRNVTVHNTILVYGNIFNIYNRNGLLYCTDKYTFYDLGIWNDFANEKYAVVCFLLGNSPANERWHIKYRSRGITQKKAYNIQNTAKVWSQGQICCLTSLAKFAMTSLTLLGVTLYIFWLFRLVTNLQSNLKKNQILS